MRRSLTIVIAAELAALPAAALAGDKDDKPKDVDKLVCKSEQFVGSNIRRRICKTQGEWDQGAVDARNALDTRRIFSNPALRPKPGG
jgi:hypothetical protein